MTAPTTPEAALDSAIVENCKCWDCNGYGDKTLAALRASGWDMAPAAELAALRRVADAARDFKPAVEALLDWMNGNDLSSDHADAKPTDYDRLCRTLEAMQAALDATPGQQVRE